MVTTILVIVSIYGCSNKRSPPVDAYVTVENKIVLPDYIYKKSSLGKPSSVNVSTAHNDFAIHIVSRLPPKYPLNMLSSGMKGSATIAFVIEKDGTTSHIQVNKATNRYFANAAINAVSVWKFKPIQIDGHTVAKGLYQTLIFKLGDSNCVVSGCAMQREAKNLLSVKISKKPMSSPCEIVVNITNNYKEDIRGNHINMDFTDLSGQIIGRIDRYFSEYIIKNNNTLTMKINSNVECSYVMRTKFYELSFTKDGSGLFQVYDNDIEKIGFM